MADTATEQKTPGKLVSAGRPVAADFRATTEGFQSPETTEQGAAAGEENGEGGAQAAAAATTTTTQQAAAPAATPGLTEDQLKEYFKAQGIDYEGVDKLKEKLAAPAAPPILTDEQKKQQLLDQEKRLLEVHTKRGGTVEQFVELKKLLTSEAKNLGIEKIKADLKAEGFHVEQIDAIVKQMHFDFTDEEIEALEEASDKDLIKKQRDFGSKKLTNRGSFIQNTAKSYMESLVKELQDSETEKQIMEQHAANVEAAIKSFQRKQTLQLGKVDDQDVDPVEFNVPDEVLNDVREILKDPAALESKIYNKEGQLNLEFLLPHLVASVSRDRIAKELYLTGGTRQVEHFKKTFGQSSAPSLGAQPRPDTTPGTIKGRGKPQPFTPAFKK